MLRFLKRNPWLVAVCMLLLSTFACSVYYPPVPYIDRVIVDTEKPARAYARLTYYTPNGEVDKRVRETPHIYQTDNYGKTWQPSEYSFPEQLIADYSLTMTDKKMWLADYVLWELPRRTFREVFFYPNYMGDDYPLLLPSGNLNNSAANGVIYIAMGTVGILVGRFEGDQPIWDRVNWSLETHGMDALTLNSLTIHDPSAIAGIIFVALLIPPLPLMHWYILQQVWVYGMPAQQASFGAAVVSWILCGCAAIAIIIWLTNVNTDYYPMVAVMTIVTVLVSVIAGFLLMRGIDLRFRLLLMLPTALVSLIVPIGVASVWWLWPLIIFLLLGFEMHRFKFTKDDAISLRMAGHPYSRWKLDRITLEAVLLGFSVAVILFVLLFWSLGSLGGLALPILALVVGLGIVEGKILRAYVTLRFNQLFAEDTSPTQETTLINVSDYSNFTFAWVGGTALVASVLFIAQFFVQGWLRSLIR